MTSHNYNSNSGISSTTIPEIWNNEWILLEGKYTRWLPLCQIQLADVFFFVCVQRGSREEDTGAVKTRPECVVIKWATEQWRPKSLVTPKRQVDKNARSLSQESCLGLTLTSPQQGQGTVHLSRPELLHVKEGGHSVCSFSMLFYFTPSHLAHGGILSSSSPPPVPASSSTKGQGSQHWPDFTTHHSM